MADASNCAARMKKKRGKTRNSFHFHYYSDSNKKSCGIALLEYFFLFDFKKHHISFGIFGCHFVCFDGF